MRQVPHYLIVGDGRVARHMAHYLGLLGLTFSQWRRADGVAALPPLLGPASHILLAITDSAIEPFVRDHLQGCAAVKIHFSGALETPLAVGAHPLSTFNTSLYDLATYRSIPFVTDEDAPADLLPGLPNPCLPLKHGQKAKYHAMCVLAGNFSCLLWQKFFAALPAEFGLPPETGHAYLRQLTENLLTDPAAAFTGPLARGDVETIRKNLAALDGDPFQSIYKSFVDLKGIKP